MIAAKKLYLLIAFIIFTTTFLYALTNDSTGEFDETEWEKIKSSTDRSLLHSSHERDGKFFNPWTPMPEIGFFTMLKWRFSGRPAYREEEEKFLPAVSSLTADYINSNDNFFTWIGHSSVLIKISGKVFITDPVFGDIQFSIKRRVPSALSYDEASKIKGEVIILLTHNHYDHLDKTSIISLPQGTKFIIPKGLGSVLTEMRSTDFKELDWWEEIVFEDVKIVFLPSQHWSRRGPFDINKSLWGSFLIEAGDKKYFICGDTGYSGIYKEIASRYKDIDYAFMSSGASQPRWLMHYNHQNETEAVRGFAELGARRMIPIHWGSFTLGDEPAGYPAIYIKKENPDVMIINGGEIIRL